MIGAEATVVFIDEAETLGGRLAAAGVPMRSLGLGPGRNVLRHPRRFAAAVAELGPDGALLVECGFMGAALRIGGYGGPIVAVEHGTLNVTMRSGLSPPRRLLRRIARVSGAWADDTEVAVSDFMLARMRRRAHARRLVRIHNGIDPDRVALPRGQRRVRDTLTIGFMGRLIRGKGADHLVRALGEARGRFSATLVVAGDGPERAGLASLAGSLGVGIEFVGVVEDLPEFWGRCDVAAVPAAELAEAFSMVTLEAMACGKAIVATRNGAIPELIVDRETGTLVAPGDIHGLAEALSCYAENPDLRHAHGVAARKRAIERFHIEECARAYLDLFADLAPSSAVHGAHAIPTQPV